MTDPYATPTDISDPNNPRIGPGYASRLAAGVFGLLFAAVAIQTLLRIRLVAMKHPLAENPIGILIGAGIWLAVLAAVVAFMWRLANHYLHPATHGFGVIDRQNAASILHRHRDVDLSQVDHSDAQYHGSSLRDLLQIYTLMDRAKHPERFGLLLLAIRSHSPDCSTESE